MIDDKQILAVIPARGGSKRLPRKNVLDLAGKPLIAWTIEAAKRSKYIDRIVVSTDDDEIAAVSKQFGADVPFMRGADLSTDEAVTIDVVMDVISKMNERYKYLVLLQPTSPLRTQHDIDGAIDQMINKGSHSVISVCRTEHSPLWCNTLDEDHSMVGFLPENVQIKRSQDLPVYYRLNGAIYLIEISVLLRLEQPTFFLSDRVNAYVMPQNRSVDIDSEYDFLMAEVMMDAMDDA